MSCHSRKTGIPAPPADEIQKTAAPPLPPSAPSDRRDSRVATKETRHEPGRNLGYKEDEILDQGRLEEQAHRLQTRSQAGSSNRRSSNRLLLGEPPPTSVAFVSSLPSPTSCCIVRVFEPRCNLLKA